MQVIRRNAMGRKDNFNNQKQKIKKELMNLNNNKLYNYVMLKIRKRKYKDIIPVLDNDIIYSILALEMHDIKYILLNKYQKRKEYLFKNRYYSKINFYRKDLTKEEIKYLINEIRYDDINIFIDNYNAFNNIFKEIDEQIGNNIPDWIFSIKLDSKIFSLSNLCGLGLYIRNNFIHNKKIESTLRELYHPDSLSRIILSGYRFYKIGIFELFKEQ
jgi:hypothetical protein